MSSSIHFLKTGYSDCIILESEGHYAMIDAAEDTDFPPDKPNLNLPGYEKEVCAYLEKNCRGDNGRVTLDFILATHAHSDHIGGFDTVINHSEIDVKKAFLKPYHDENVFIAERLRWDNLEVYRQMKTALIKNSVPITEEFDGHIEKLGDFTLTFFNGIYKKPRFKYGENVNSVVVLAEANGQKALLAGDMDYTNGGEKKIAKKVGRVNLLKVGHHGYFGSTSFYWIKKLMPKYAVVCNSKSKMYPDVLFKLKHISKSVLYCTEDCSGVKAIFEKNRIVFKKNIM